MAPQLEVLFNALEAQRSELMRSLQALSPEILNRQPAGKWSILQIIAHLIAAERISIIYMKKKMLGVVEAPDTGWFEELKIIGLQISQRLPLKFRAPKVVIEQTVESADIRQLHADWSALRQELKNLLDSLKEVHVKRKIYKHVRAGRLNIQHALIFFREHIIHHRPQIKNRVSFI